MTSIVWLILSIVLLVVELLTMALTTIWFAAGAIIAFFASLLGVGLKVQWILFIIVSFVMLVITRPVVLKLLKGRTIKTNADALVGTDALVTKTIDNKAAMGEVSVNGLIWTARTEDSGKVIEPDKWVTIQSIQGVKLIVKEKNV